MAGGAEAVADWQLQRRGDDIREEFVFFNSAKQNSNPTTFPVPSLLGVPASSLAASQSQWGEIAQAGPSSLERSPRPAAAVLSTPFPFPLPTHALITMEEQS